MGFKYYEQNQLMIPMEWKTLIDKEQVQLKGKGEIKGYLNNQFSMDEYEGNLRIATTSNDGEETSNQLYGNL